MKFPNIYESKHYKKLIVIPLLLILVSLFFIKDIPKGVDLKGGSLFTIMTDAPAGELQQKRIELEGALGAFSTDVSVRTFENPTGRGFEIEIGTSANLDEAETLLAALKEKDLAFYTENTQLQYMEANEKDLAKLEAQQNKVDALKNELITGVNTILKLAGSQKTVTDTQNAVQVAEEEYQNVQSSNRERVISEIRKVVPVASYSTKEIGASLSRFFLSKTTEILLVSLGSAALFVILIFRGKTASLAVMFGAFADLVITAGVMGLLGIPLSLATIAALLMLIGFSIDTDMLLTIRGLKRTEGSAKERVYDAMKTAIVMNASAISAFSVLLLTAAMLRIETYYQIGAVAVIGGLIDFIATWCGNAVMVLWYAEIREKGQ
ncbi:MAG: hypothetical protein V1835_02790 [Candidatus Micrarchaeota archaeon]